MNAIFLSILPRGEKKDEEEERKKERGKIQKYSRETPGRLQLVNTVAVDLSIG